MIPILSSSVNNLRPLGLNVYETHCSDLLVAGCHFENLPVNIIVYIKQQKTSLLMSCNNKYLVYQRKKCPMLFPTHKTELFLKVLGESPNES